MNTSKPTKRKNDYETNWFWYNVVCRLIGWVITRKNDIHIHNEEIKDLKAPFIAVGNHQGKWDFIYAYKALLPHRASVVSTRYQFFRPLSGFIIKKVGTIGKSQFASDPSALKSIIRKIKSGGNILIYLSGRLSLFGEDAKPFRGSYELLKNLKVPVVMLQLDGGFRTNPRYNQVIKKSGRVDITARILFTPEDFQTISDEEGKKRLNDAFCHDDYNSPNIGEYKSKNIIEGLSDILYICPACKTNFQMKTEGKNIIKCEKCGFTAKMDNSFRLKGENGFTSPETISEWGRLIRAEEKKRITENPDYSLKADMILSEHVKKSQMLTPIGNVHVVYDKNGFHLKGDRKGEPFERTYSCEEYPAVHFLEKCYLIVPDTEDVICATPPTAGEVVQWAVVSEAFSDLQAAEKLSAIKS